MNTKQELINQYRDLIQKARKILEQETLTEDQRQEATRLLGEADVVKARLEVLEREEFLAEGAIPKAATFRPAGPNEGSPETSPHDWDEVTVKSVEIDPVFKVPVVQETKVRFYIPKSVQRPGYASAFEAYLRKGASRLGPNDAKALAEGTDEAGGFLVPPDFQALLIRKIAAQATIRANARVITTLRDSVQMPKVKATGDIASTPFQVTWTGELPGTDPDVATTDVFGLYTIPVHTAMASCPLSNNVIEDSTFDILGFVADALAEAFALGENQAFITGDGVTKPYGLITAAAASEIAYVASGSASALTADGLISLAYALPPQYETNAKWLMNKATEAAIRKMKSTTDLYYWPIQAQVGAFGPVVPSLLGYPIVREQAMPDVAGNAYPIIFGDLRGYLIVDRVGISLQRLSEVYALRNVTVILGRKRVGGYPVEPWRFRVQKVAAS
jgi:HK97 family phage major capsid protein